MANNITPEVAESDWRVRLHLPNDSKVLYKTSEAAAGNSILHPLIATDGIIFPYTPVIQVQYNADYSNYDLVHSNYRGYFYKGSQVQNIIVTATFTAQDQQEAEYLLAAMHFLRSCTKMFYGNDDRRGTPPPVVMLSGLGEYQFKNHPCAVTAVHYNLPNDVDYIPAGVTPQQASPSQLTEPVKPVNESWSNSISRLINSGINHGGVAARPSSSATETTAAGPIKVYNHATYVPTKIDINFTMIPIQTRKQVSDGFSLEKYASGALLKKGYW